MERPQNTASRDRGAHKIISEYLKGSEKRHTPVTRVKVAKGENSSVKVSLYTSRPDVLRQESSELVSVLSESFGQKTVSIDVVPEARAVAKFVRVTPRKARLVIETIKGKRVSDALAILQFTANRAAEPLSKVLLSAAANALDSWGADPTSLKVANFIADGGPTLKRLQPRAQGRAYRILKRTSHLTVILLDTPPAPRRKTGAKAKQGSAKTSATISKTKAAAGAA